MQSNPPNLGNLNLLFNQYDSDQDGHVNDDEILKILQEIGYTDVYIGTIRKVIRLMNISQPQNKLLNFPQLEEYAQALITKGKFTIWKLKLTYHEMIKEALNDLYEEEDQGNGASPGAGPGSAPTQNKQKSPNSQHGEILINIGNNTIPNQHFSFSLEKQKGQQIKPFVKISIQRNTNEEALKIQNLFKQIYATLIDILQAEQEQLMPEILSVSFITSVTNNVFNLFVTTGNKELIDLVEIFSEYFDEIFKQPVNGKIHASYKFDFDFQKFISDPNYNFYDMVVKNSSIHLEWNLWEFFAVLRKIALKLKAFQSLEWDSTDESCLFLIGLLHCEKFVGKMEFNSTSSEGQQTKSKEELNQIFNGIKNNLQNFGQQTNMQLLQMVRQMDGKISIEAGVKDWKLNIEAKLNNFTKIFTESIEKNQSLDEGGNIPNQEQFLSLGGFKQSSLKDLNKIIQQGESESKFPYPVTGQQNQKIYLSDDSSDD